ncbi:MAG: DUF3634 family protein [Akkermansiaceae bacterium]|nr:DUF3634 family protein [Akkermansiaceae bacterium]
MKWFSRLLSVTVISITGSNITCKKGKITPSLIGEIQDIFSDLSISWAEIWIDGAGKVSFSIEIPSRYHQRLRNLLIGAHPTS